jgi:hypothetical protein
MRWVALCTKKFSQSTGGRESHMSNAAWPGLQRFQESLERPEKHEEYIPDETEETGDLYVMSYSWAVMAS